MQTVIVHLFARLFFDMLCCLGFCQAIMFASSKHSTLVLLPVSPNLTL